MRIVIASILKPVDDTRMYEKLAQSIAETNKYEINIIGFRSKVPNGFPEIRFHPLFHFNRLGFKRFLAPIKFLSCLINLKPALVIICTYELLVVTVLYRIFSRVKIIYDVQEDYKENIRCNTTLPKWIATPMGAFVRVLEKTTQPWVDHYLLAEKVFRKLSFVKKNHLILENKYKQVKGLVSQKIKSDKIRFIYSGTIATSFGIFEALELFEKIYQEYRCIELEIVGYCADHKVLQSLRDRIFDKPDIRLVGGSHLVPHQTILQHLVNADYGLVSYRKEPNITNRFPTKIFEYLAIGLPMILQDHPPWVNLCKEAKSAIAISYEDYEVKEIWQQIQQQQFYPEGPYKKALWSYEGEKLKELVSSLLSNIN